MSQLRQRPLDAAILEALRHHCESAKDPGTWAEALEHHARAAEDADIDPIARGRLHFELGNLYRDHLRRLDRAVLHYRSAADSDPAQRPAIAAARALFADAGNWDQVAKLAALEAESLPRGQKRAQLLAELAEVQSTHLDDIPAALETLREAVASAPAELTIRHQLATALLELADRESDAERATAGRNEAAETLAEMAKRVTDDYAFAYAEAALDAAPANSAALDVLESVAPRIGRDDAVATRWVAALQHAPNDPGARQIRLKLARAYELANQLEDARVCLEPIATVNDPEARAMLAGLGASAAHKEFSLFESDDPFPEGARSLAEELGAMLQAEEDAQASTPPAAKAPLNDLSALADADDRRHIEPRPSESPRMLEPGEHDEEEILTVPGMPQHVRDVLEASARAAAEEEAEEAGDVTVIAASAWQVAALADREATGEAGPTEAPIAAEALADAASEPTDALAEPTAPRAAALADALAQVEHEDDEDEDEDASEVNDDELTREPTAPRSSLPLIADGAATPDDTMAAATTEPPRSDVEPAQPEAPSEPVDELTALRADLERRLKFRDRRGAAEVAERIIQLGGLDSGAVAALEEHYRTTRDFRRMRDLALRIAGEPDVDEEERVSRLREAAMLSESKLGDVEGTAKALVGLLELRPLDEEAYGKLKRMFLRLGRFDDLAKLFAQTAEALPTSREQAARYRELFTLHRDKRRSSAEAIEALERTRELAPGDAADDIALYDLYRSVGRHGDAAVLLRTRIDTTEEPVERVPLLSELAELVETQLNDVDAAYEANAELLRIAPRHAESLDRAARIETSMERFDLLVETLRKKLESAEGAARLPLILRIADLTMGELSTPAEAAEVLSEALSITPQDRELWQKAAVAFDAADRAAEFDERLDTVLTQSRDAALRFDAGAMLAARRELADDLPGAIAAREAQITIRREEAALTSLVSLLRRADRPSELARRLDDLARMVEPEVARGLRLERAALLGERLQNPEAAKSELERILSEIAPDDPAVLTELVELARRTEDVPRRVRAQERLLHVTRELEQRIELAEDLVEVYERSLGDAESALRVLRLWCEFDRSNPRPRIRLLPLLESRGERAELVSTLDALAALAIADDEAGEYVQRAARVAMELGDYDGAWNRLVPRVVEAADAGAEVLLTQLALRARRGEQLAELYVGLAQRAEGVDAQKTRWTSAARVYDTMVGDPARALEAALRAFAKDLDDPALLSDVDRLAEAARADKRLTQVYDSLVRRAATPAKRADLLLRHAKLIEERLSDLPQALERASLAFQVDPSDERAYAEGIRLAERAELPAEAMRLHELRADTSRVVATRLNALLAGCAVAARALVDGARAIALMERAVALAYGDDALLDHVEQSVSAIDGATPAVSRDALLRALADTYGKRASELRESADASGLYARAAHIHERELGDQAGAFAFLTRASKAAPEQNALLDELERIAPDGALAAELAQHLETMARDAIDSNIAVEALRRLAGLYEGPLADAGRAADAYEEELKLRPSDRQAHARLRRCLREAGRYKELLVAIDRELTLDGTPAERAALLCESAETWEHALRNRFEARDAYRKALALAPDNDSAQAALERLSKRESLDDAFLLDGDLTVRPEDLRPSLPEAEPPVAASEEAASAPEALAEAAPEANVRAEGAEAADETRAEAADETGADAATAEEHLAAALPTTHEANDLAPPAEHEAPSTQADTADSLVDEVHALAVPAIDTASALAETTALDAAEPASTEPETETVPAEEAPSDEPVPAEEPVLADDAQEKAAASDDAADSPELAPADDGMDDAWTSKIRVGMAGSHDSVPTHAVSAEAEAEADAEAESAHDESTPAPSEPAPSEPAPSEPAPSEPAPSDDIGAPEALVAAPTNGAAAHVDSAPHSPSDEDLPHAQADSANATNDARDDDLAGLDELDDIEELDADELDLSADEDDAAKPPEGLDALSGLVVNRMPSTPPPANRKAPPPPPRAASRTDLAPQIPAPPRRP